MFNYFLVSVLQRNRSNKVNTHIYRERQEEIIIRNWLTWLWRLRIPWPAICKLETQESGGTVPGLVQKSKGLAPGELMESMMLTHSEQGCLLSSPIQMLISSGNTLMDTPRNIVYPGHSVAQSNWCIKLTITSSPFANLAHIPISSKPYLISI